MSGMSKIVGLLVASTAFMSGAVSDAEDSKPVSLPPVVERAVDFKADIEPLFVKHCVQCHGSEKQQSGLRFDRRQEALNGGDSGKAIQPGKSAESLLIKLVSGTDPDRIMPPKGEKLTAAEVGLLRGWIDQGAKWPEDTVAQTRSTHWSYQPITRPAPPAVKDANWVRNPLDAFVLARLESEGFAPSPEASPTTLIRRLSLDLLGLPPTPDEVAQFVTDSHPDAYERLVDRLLASPHFGERWGRHWLDEARYADSDGYEKDSPRPFAYRYRDWVIDAINRDLPFDQFTIEQLAGDLLPGATQEQRMATGFQRNTLTNTEGGADQEEFRVAATVDRVNTAGTIWLGLTVGCAQCHTHKYDAITQREYYQLFAFFNSLDEVNRPAPAPDEAAAHAAMMAKSDAEHAPLVAQLAEFEKAELPVRQAAWEPTFKATAPTWTTLEPTKTASAKGATLTKEAEGAVLATGADPSTDSYAVEATTSLKTITAIRLEALADDKLPSKGPGRTPHGNFVLTEFRLEIQAAGANAIAVPLQNATADFEQIEKGKPYFTAGATLDGKHDTGWAVAGQLGQRHVAVYETATNLEVPSDSRLVITLDQQYGSQHTLGKFRLSVTDSPRPVRANGVPDQVPPILALPAGQRTADQQALLTAYFKSIDPEYLRLQAAVAAHLKTVPQAPPTMAQMVAERAEPRLTQIHIRGDFLRKGDPVAPGTLAVLSPATLSEKPTRLDFARWLVDPANPLTARVTINHWWKDLFGRGLVATPDDFGVKGERPSHPELLDWLASELMQPTVGVKDGTAAVGWSRKRMLRLLVTSATYRQASALRDDLQDHDPRNVLLARQARFRLESEAVRDTYLAVSGLMNRRIGGPSVRPPLPPGVAELGYAGSVKWPETTGPEKYRRGMYIFFQRTVPYPMLITFDSPDSNATCVRRERSNTPLQALTLLNDPVFVECAQAFGNRLLTECPTSVSDRLKRGFQLCVAREPASVELQRLEQLHVQISAAAMADESLATKLAGTLPAGTALPEAAATVATARILLNLDEFLTRE